MEFNTTHDIQSYTDKEITNSFIYEKVSELQLETILELQRIRSLDTILELQRIRSLLHPINDEKGKLIAAALLELEKSIVKKWGNFIMVNLMEWAEKELERLVKDDDEMQKEINKDILQVVETFSTQGHSGFSANYALNILKRLLAYKPITPLTGEEDEWAEPYDWDETKLQQNKRCFGVFRKNYDNSTAYYIEGKVFSDDGGNSWYTNKDSFVPITFPYIVPEAAERIILKTNVE